MSSWAESDFPPPGQPALGSYTEPRSGQVYTMYHGTTREAAASIRRTGFKQSYRGMLGRGVYLSRDLQKASRYPLDLPENQRVVLKVSVYVGRVKKIDYQGHPMQKTWHDHGYDTAWCPPDCGMVKSGLEEDCVWDPDRIHIIEVIYPKSNLTFWMFAIVIMAVVILLFPELARTWNQRHLRCLNTISPTLHHLVKVIVKVNVGRVITIRKQGHPKQKTWHEHSYDTAWCPPGCGMVPSGLEEDCVWDPKMIEIIEVILPRCDNDGIWAAADWVGSSWLGSN
ncbi:uncharacterized protein LOC134454764 [Engraulis encrasicolus]|uniref:uncharacterized protein LOC134454764 n=1 Tax=Engraulis encrasicolus TaxID=184585 RepID=UPI002FD3DAA8